MNKVESGIDTLEKMGVNGYVGFSIKAKDNKHNRAIVTSFLDFARIECGNNYTIAIKKLLENNQKDYLLEVISMKVVELENRINELTKSKTKQVVDDDEVF